ncbi:MAG: bacillithiol biosynthesis BshC, partial [Longimicrobiaceae bacterium]
RRRMGIDAAEVRLPEHELWEKVARRHLPAELWARLRAVREGIVDGFGRVADVAEGIDPNLVAAVGARRDRALLEVAKAERTVVRHFKRRSGALEREVRTVQNHLHPRGTPQERMLTVFQYLPRDPGLLSRLAEAMVVELAAEESNGGLTQSHQRDQRHEPTLSGSSGPSV